jgi:two-component system, chemotaxis family, chemotaxis protein CheY
MPVRTLIVDDSPVVRKTLRLRFEKAGFEVVGEALNASEGLEMFRTLQPQLVTLDLMMPKVGETDAKVLFRSIREERPEVAVIVISAQPKGVERAEYMRKGAGLLREAS